MILFLNFNKHMGVRHEIGYDAAAEDINKIIAAKIKKLRSGKEGDDNKKTIETLEDIRKSIKDLTY